MKERPHLNEPVNPMTDEQFKNAVTHGKRSKMAVMTVAIYEHPRDFPKSYVARAHFSAPGRTWPSPEIFVIKDTLEEIRAIIPLCMTNIGRKATDDRRIIEVYA